MGKKNFYTRIRWDHTLGTSEYVHGRVFGILRAVCIGNSDAYEYAVTDDGIGLVYEVKCTKGRYEKAKKIVKKLYPGLCDFDI